MENMLNIKVDFSYCEGSTCTFIFRYGGKEYRLVAEFHSPIDFRILPVDEYYGKPVKFKLYLGDKLIGETKTCLAGMLNLCLREIKLYISHF